MQPSMLDRQLPGATYRVSGLGRMEQVKDIESVTRAHLGRNGSRPRAKEEEEGKGGDNRQAPRAGSP